MDPALFLADLEALPGTLAAVDRATFSWPRGPSPGRIVLTGMGSSYFAARSVATVLRSHGLTVIAERSSVVATWPPGPDLLVVGISASGGSAETLELLARHHGVSVTVALTNTPGSAIGGLADATVELAAGIEVGGVACRSYHHTLVALLALSGAVGGPEVDVAGLAGSAAEAAEDLLARRGEWLDDLAVRLDGADGVWLLAPEERLGNALQGALMIREGPRRAADACETGDWSHVDVYLTKTLDYRALVFSGSRFDAPAARWMIERRSTAVGVGPPFPGAAASLRYRHDERSEVAGVVEALVPSLLAQRWWARATPDASPGAATGPSPPR